MELTHGGDWVGYRAKFGHDALDFSANVSPLGLPEGVALAIVNALPTADRYPDPLCRELRQKLSASENVHENQILCGNGAADLIFRLVLAKKPRRALLPAPTFAEYASALKTVGCEVEYFFLKEENDFEITEELLSALHETIDMVFLCQPNNPTGQIVTSDLLEKFLKKCRAVSYTTDAADDEARVVLGGRRSINNSELFQHWLRLAGACFCFLFCHYTGADDSHPCQPPR